MPPASGDGAPSSRALVSQVGTLYYDLRSLDLELEIAQRTLTSREESLRLTEIRERGGAAPLVDVRQAEQLVYSARGQIVDTQRRIEQSENGLSVLLGRNPGPIARGKPLIEQAVPPTVPDGLPSTILERRPDIQAAEQSMVAANARIGVAKAAYFPQISLTGSGGVASTALSDLFTAGAWSLGANLVQPIFNAGRKRSQVALAEARRDESELVYQQTIQQAFREVADALVGYRRLREFREAQQQVVIAAQDSRRLADLRYRGGATSYLEVHRQRHTALHRRAGPRRGAAGGARGLRRDLSRARRRLEILSNGDLMSHRNVEISDRAPADG